MTPDPGVGVPATGTFGSATWPLQLIVGDEGEVIDLAPDPHREPPTVVALLSVDCLGCRPFWDDLASGSSVLEGRALPVVVLERPHPAGLRVVGRAPVVVVPGLAERLGVDGRPAFLVVPDGDVSHAWCGAVGAPIDLAVVVAQVARRARAHVGAGPLPSDVAVGRSPGVAEVELDGQLVLYDPGRGLTLALDPSTEAVWRALASEPAPSEVVGRRVAAGRGAEAPVVALDADAVVALLVRRGWARRADDAVGPDPVPLDVTAGATPGPCCGDDHQPWGRVVDALVVSISGQRRGVHVDDRTVADRLRARLGSAVVPGAGTVAEDFALIVGGGGGGGGGPALWHGTTLVARHADPAVLVEVLAGELERLAPPQGSGWAVDAAPWIGPAGAVCVLGRRPLAEQPWEELQERGLRPALGPVAIEVDGGRAALVESGPVHGPDRPRPATRHRLVGWVAVGRPAAVVPVVAALPLLAAHLRPPSALTAQAAAAELVSVVGSVPLVRAPEGLDGDAVATLLASEPPKGT